MAHDGVPADSLRQDVKELVNQLDSCVMPLRRFVDDYHAAGCPAALERDYNNVLQTIQILNETIPDNQRNVTAQAQSIPATPKTPPPPDKAKPVKKDPKVAAFVILFPVAFRQEQKRSISQDLVFDLLCKFDPTQRDKRPSFTAKLANYRKPPKKFLYWVDVEDVKISDPGMVELRRLYGIVREKGGDFEEARRILEDFTGCRLEDMGYLAAQLPKADEEGSE
ncbi:hypothetical protein J7443_10580 [Tropicibacter sp. R15_0]|uniref:hypothetical protein n=1 Tax=Tropicibacter sp. R15_0 TaxID=2821101 RepID=UPI001ADCFFF4|nr:hypothetical protein [Tropicibacter sp. R15_0]MBO9465674.1 hypothetical protein [Tropicibacter sp. R15_0]